MGLVGLGSRVNLVDFSVQWVAAGVKQTVHRTFSC